MVQDSKEVVVVAELGRAGRVGVVGGFVGDLEEHGCDEHVDSGGGLDQILEGEDGWVQGFGRGGVDVGEDGMHPVLVGLGVRGHPFADAVEELGFGGCGCHFGDRLLVIDWV